MGTRSGRIIRKHTSNRIEIVEIISLLFFQCFPWPEWVEFSQTIEWESHFAAKMHSVEWKINAREAPQRRKEKWNENRNGEMAKEQNGINGFVSKLCGATQTTFPCSVPCSVPSRRFHFPRNLYQPTNHLAVDSSQHYSYLQTDCRRRRRWLLFESGLWPPQNVVDGECSSNIEMYKIDNSWADMRQ